VSATLTAPEIHAAIRPFRVEVPQADLDDLRRRLAAKPMGARR
jgi:hypothetical protein